ncbi:MAG: FGGY-family carbohydrate kinase [Tannerella sp.]|jgi:sugar (pentulose or hexulose) kinase|nr:FGGY-family carbohydrate kinase [Tannerella sp.]
MNPYYLGIDLGTTNFKAGIFDQNRRLLGLGRLKTTKISDGTTCELPVSVFWETLHGCVSEAVMQAQIDVKDIVSVGYASQANSFILLDANNEAITPLILWPDNRAKGLKIPLPEHFTERTGIGVMPDHQFAIAKLLWFQRLQPELWTQTAKVLSVSAYLTYSLTGLLTDDYGTASMTGMFDQSTTDWWDEMLAMLNIGRELLPSLARTGTPSGRLTASGAEKIGILPGTRFFTGGLDHHIAAVGAGIIGSGRLCESTGTVLACVDYTSDYQPQCDVCVAPGLSEGRFFRMTFDDNGASVLEKYQKDNAPDLTIPELLHEAEAFAEGIANRHGEKVMKILVSTAQNLASLAKRLKNTSEGLDFVSTGGGSRSPLWIKIKSETLNSTFYTPEQPEVACLGATIIAGAGCHTQS